MTRDRREPRTYVVILQQESAEAVDLLKQNYPGNAHYAVNSRLYFIRTADLIGGICEKVGILKDEKSGDQVVKTRNLVSGVVLRLNGISAGFASSDVWDWLDATA